LEFHLECSTVDKCQYAILLSKIILIGLSAQYLSGWIFFGLWQWDWKLGDFLLNWENVGELGDFWIFQFPP
jgi:hypothetical protein